ncbi:MAG: 12,18-didecarboxysiroheme deacetylase [Acidobacteriota bacterium]
MIGISKLYLGTVEPSDLLRYGRKSKNLPSNLLQFSEDKKPVVVWNMTRTCNLKCVHCYSQSTNKIYEDELTTHEAKKLIEDLASYGVPVLLFSGGEPLIRKDFFELAIHAKNLGIRTVVSTNGTLITKDVARSLKKIGLSYVGISLDGIEETNDNFRGVKGAFKRAIGGIRNCQEQGLKVGLRFTINKRNVKDIPEIFNLIVEENIQRICFYHLVYSGRGSELIDEDLSHGETRATVDLIIDKTKEMYERGFPKEVLTVDNHADGVYLYLRMKKEKNPRSNDVLKLLQMNGGNSTGIGIGCISWDGNVHPDQFWRHYSFGNVREKKFSQIWEDLSDPLIAKLKYRKPYLKGKCLRCRWINICNGNFRVRAEAKTGDVWEKDPACYLTDEEIGLK